LIASVASVTNVGDSVVRLLSSVAGQTVRALTAQGLRRLLTTAGFDVVYQRRVPRFGFVPGRYSPTLGFTARGLRLTLDEDVTSMTPGC
jgi:hypothetical protein